MRFCLGLGDPADEAVQEPEVLQTHKTQERRERLVHV